MKRNSKTPGPGSPGTLARLRARLIHQWRSSSAVRDTEPAGFGEPPVDEADIHIALDGWARHAADPNARPQLARLLLLGIESHLRRMNAAIGHTGRNAETVSFGSLLLLSETIVGTQVPAPIEASRALKVFWPGIQRGLTSALDPTGRAAVIRTCVGVLAQVSGYAGSETEAAEMQALADEANGHSWRMQRLGDRPLLPPDGFSREQ